MHTDDHHQARAIGRHIPVMALRWTGNFVPQLGQRVRVTSQGRGPGRVLGFFAAQGQLGVQVTLDEPSGPWTKELSARKRAMVFGHEIEIEPEASE